MASPSTTINANLNINPASVKSSQKKVQSAFSNINLNSKSVSQFSNSLGRITGQATEFKKSMDAATARVFAFGATAAVINSISQSFRALVASTIEVEKRLIEINSIFGATEKQFASFRKSIFEVAKNTGQSFAVVADGAAELARQGLSAEETAKRLNASLILTRVSGLDAVSSVNSLTAALNGFTSAGLTAESVVNKIIAVDTAFAVSAKDLAEGFQRAGSTAEDAGVSFDELLGLITAVQQKTARGGAVIGNAFKSIFTRLSRGTTISELQSLGVEIDASQSGVKKLQALSSALENVADPNVASQIKELAGGVFQINVVSAALKDLSNETSIFADAASKSAAASNEAFSKNEALNKSLAAQINTLIVSATNLAEKLGQLTLAPVISDLTSLATKFTGFLSNALDEDSGNALIKGFFKGIATFIQGPGIILVTGAFLNIFKIVARFAKEGFQDLLRIGSGQEKIKSIEAGIVQLLSQDATLRKQLVSTTLSQAQKEQLVIQAIQRENALLREQQAILAGLAASAARAGVTGFGVGRGFSGKRGRGFASGFTPIEGAMEVAEARSLGARGTVRPRLSKGTIGGRKFIMNSQETEIPNFGRNGDSAVIPHYGKGFIPNFVKRRGARSNQQQVFDGNTPVEEFEKLSDTQLKSFAKTFPNAKTALANKKAGKTALGSEGNRININASKFGFLIPKVGAKQSLTKRGNFSTPKGKIFFDMKGVNVRGPILPKNVDKIEDPEAADLEEAIKGSMVDKATRFAQLLKGPSSKPSEASVKKRLQAQKGGLGAIGGAVGAAFEAGVATALGVEEIKISRDQGDFDLRGSINKDLFTLFDVDRFDLGEFKASARSGNLNSFAKKIVKESTGKSFNLRGNKNFPIAGKAAGFIPNFANPLVEAISRETSGTGISKNQVRISNDKRLANKSNPLGLAVTNTRDEPNGLRDVFAKGFIPNFKKPDVDSTKGARAGIAGNVGLGLSLALSFLTEPITKLASKGNKAAKEAAKLNIQLEGLEKELEGVNQTNDPEKFSSLSDEIAALKESLKEASTEAAEFDSQVQLTVSGISAAVVALSALPLPAAIPTAAAAAGGFLGFTIGKENERIRARLGDVVSSDQLKEENKRRRKIAREGIIEGLLTGDLDKAFVLGNEFNPLTLATKAIQEQFVKFTVDPAIEAAKEFEDQLKGFGVEADLERLAKGFNQIASSSKSFSESIQTSSRSFLTSFQSPDAVTTDFNRNFVGGVDSRLALAQRASKLDFSLGEKQTADDRRKTLSEQTQANRDVISNEFNKTIVSLREDVQSSLDKQAQAAGFSGLSGIDVSGGRLKDSLASVRQIVGERAVAAAADNTIGGGGIETALDLGQIEQKLSELSGLSPSEAVAEFQKLSQSDLVKRTGSEQLFSSAGKDFSQILAGEAITSTAADTKRAIDDIITLSERGEAGALSEVDAGRLEESFDKLVKAGVLTQDAANEYIEGGRKFLQDYRKVTEDDIIKRTQINLDDLKERREIQREFLAGLKENFGSNLTRAEEFIETGAGLGDFQGREIEAFSSDFFNKLISTGVTEDASRRASGIGASDTKALAGVLKSGTGTELSEQLRTISDAAKERGITDVGLSQIQKQRLSIVGKNFSEDQFTGLGLGAQSVNAREAIATIDRSLDNIDSVADISQVGREFQKAFDAIGSIDTTGDPQLQQNVAQALLTLVTKFEFLETIAANALLPQSAAADKIVGQQLQDEATAIKTQFQQDADAALQESQDARGERGAIDQTTVEGGEVPIGVVLSEASKDVADFAETLSKTAKGLEDQVIGDTITSVNVDLENLQTATQNASDALRLMTEGVGDINVSEKLNLAGNEVSSAVSSLASNISLVSEQIAEITRGINVTPTP